MEGTVVQLMSFVIVYAAALVLAVMANRSNWPRMAKAAAGTAPYVVGLWPLAIRAKSPPLFDLLGYALLFCVLTWVLTWSIRKQWGT